jgi:phosphatidylinositol 3-kinase
MSNPIYEARYREVFVSFQEKLSSVFVEKGRIMSSSKSQSNSKTPISLWALLGHQEKFISGIMNCQKDSLQIRGKKDAKESHLKEALEEYRSIPHAVPLPSAPHIFVKGVNPTSARMFKSALYPAVVDFVVDHDHSSRHKEEKSEALASNPKEDQSLFKVMVKTGDDLRQDQLVIMMIQLMDGLLKRGTLDLW